jgi:hypothetical protein
MASPVSNLRSWHSLLLHKRGWGMLVLPLLDVLLTAKAASDVGVSVSQDFAQLNKQSRPRPKVWRPGLYNWITACRLILPLQVHYTILFFCLETVHFCACAIKFGA